MLLWRVVRKKMSLIRNYAQSPWAVSSPPARFYPPFFFSVGGGPAVFLIPLCTGFGGLSRIRHALPGSGTCALFLAAYKLGRWGCFPVCRTVRQPLFAKCIFAARPLLCRRPIRRGTARLPLGQAAARGRVGWFFMMVRANFRRPARWVTPASGRVNSAPLPRRNHKNRAFSCIFHIIYYLVYTKSAFFVVFFCRTASGLFWPPCAALALPAKKTQRRLPLCFLSFLFYSQRGWLPRHFVLPYLFNNRAA